MALDDTKVAEAKSDEKSYKLPDGSGLHLLMQAITLSSLRE
ncbi:hypothetical protein ABN063_15170 [Providencia vermicola]|nr:hypothetical protein [Providencia vermicola]